MQVFLIAAITLDGFIAQHTDQPSTKWTSQEDKDHFHKKTQQAGVIVMGKTTFDTIGFALPQRLNIIYTTESREELASRMNLDQNQLRDEVLRTTVLDPKDLISQLTQEGFEQVAICGGSSIYTQFMQAKLVDKLFLTVEPIIFGNGIKLFNQPINQKLSLISSKQLNEKGTLLLEYDCESK